MTYQTIHELPEADRTAYITELDALRAAHDQRTDAYAIAIAALYTKYGVENAYWSKRAANARRKAARAAK